MDQQLSEPARAALKAVEALSLADQARVVSLVSASLAARIHEAASTAPPEKLAKASSHIDEAVKTAAHGFKQVTAPDGTAAIEVKIRRPTGKEVTILFSEGARDKFFDELGDYGKSKLNVDYFATHDDFKAVVRSLWKAIKGLKVVDYRIQTDDAALKQAYEIVKEGVRRAGGVSKVRFRLGDGGAIVGRRTQFEDRYFYNWIDYPGSCAAFVSPPAEYELKSQ